MSTVVDTKEIEAWYDYTSRMRVAVRHREIRSHRSAPSGFPIRRILLVFMLLALSGAWINVSQVSQTPAALWQPARPGDTPGQLIPEFDVPNIPDSTTDSSLRVDTGSKVSLARQMNRREIIKDQSVKHIPPPTPIEKVIQYALAQQGKPYRWAQAGPNGYDCSGLVLASFKQIGIKLPHYTGTMIRYGKAVSRSQMQRGDIIFPTSGHVAIYLGNGLQVAASSGKHRVVVQPVYGFYAARRLV